MRRGRGVVQRRGRGLRRVGPAHAALQHHLQVALLLRAVAVRVQARRGALDTGRRRYRAGAAVHAARSTAAETNQSDVAATAPFACCEENFNRVECLTFGFLKCKKKIKKC